MEWRNLTPNTCASGARSTQTTRAVYQKGAEENRRRSLSLARALVLVLLALSVVTTQAQVPIYPWPSWPPSLSGAPTVAGGYTVNAASEKAALICIATAAKAIRKVHLRTGTVTTGDTMDVRVETVDSAANGDPTGTLWASGGSANASLAIANGDDNVWKSATLTNDTNALAIGDVFALVVVNGGGGGNMAFATYGDASVVSLPYGDLFDTGAWAKQTTMPMFVPEYSDGSFVPCYGFLDQGGPVSTNSYDSNDTTNRRGNIFQVAAAVTAVGCWGWVDADGDYTCKIYDSDGSTVLATTATISAFQRQQNGGGLALYPFLASASLSAGVNYRVAYVPTTTTATISTYDFDVPSAGMLDAFPGGQLMHRSVFTSSAWVETTTSRTYIGLLFSDTNVSSGGGGRIIGGGQ